MIRSPALLVFGSLLIGSLGCRGFATAHQVHQVIPSPSGEWKAVVTSWEPPGGALADCQFSIHVLPSNEGIPMWMRAPWRGQAAWFSEFVLPAYVFWRDERSIVIVVDRQTGGHGWIRQSRGSIAVETRVLASSDKRLLVDVDHLPLVRLREDSP